MTVSKALEAQSHYNLSLYNGWVSSFEFQKMGQKTTVCLLTLHNGFEVVGVSACVRPENFDKHLGEKYAMENAFQKLDEFVGFALQDEIHGGK